MNPTVQALETLIKAVAIANKRGAFELSESAAINEAVMIFSKKSEEGEKRPQTTVAETSNGSDTNTNESTDTGTETSQSEA